MTRQERDRTRSYDAEVIQFDYCWHDPLIFYATYNPAAISRWIHRVPLTHGRFISFLIED